MEDITVEELKQRMESNEELLILDVREVWENEEYNIGGKLIPLGQLQFQLDEIADWKDKEVIVHCKSGGRSGVAKNFMIGRGFTNVRNLLGGMMAWQAIN